MILNFVAHFLMGMITTGFGYMVGKRINQLKFYRAGLEEGYQIGLNHVIFRFKELHHIVGKPDSELD